MFCTVCATANPLPAERCATCGAGLVQTTPRRNRATAPHSRSHRSGRLRGKFGRALTLVPLVLVLTAGGTVAARYHSERSGLAAAYDRAERALAAGDYDAAIAAFAQAGSYRDAPGRRGATQRELAPYRDAYYDGAAALDAGRYDDAIAALLPVARALPMYHDVLSLLDEARAQRDGDLARDAEVAIARHDWLAADRALSQLLAADPKNGELAGRLAALRRDHAPILFTRDAGLYVVGPDLADERLIADALPAAAPAWSPDRSRIVFFSPNPDALGVADLYVVDVDGTDLRRIAELALMDWWPAWSPDGTRIAYSSAASFSINEERGFASTHVVDLATGVDTDLTGGHFTSATSATWSPTGDRLAFVSRRVYSSIGLGNVRSSEGEVFVADFATGEITSITDDRLPGAVRVTWSPTEDKLLALTGEDNAASYGQPRTAIHLIDLTTGNIEQLTPRTQTVGPPYWSPEGTRFAYVEGNTDQGNSVVRVRWLAGRREAGIGVSHPITTMLTWSPDGKALIAMASRPEQGSTLIPLPDGTGSQVNLPITFDLDPNLGPLQWSPFNPAHPPAPPSYGGTALDATSRRET
ncbi:MAG: TolB protein [Thermomicrobiales bacterium]|nr:TolB protein [Thermomicrobiales bacterium]